MLVHEWWGLNDYVRKRAEQLAGMGYVAFALDMFGEGKQTRHPQQAGEWSKAIMQNQALWRDRAAAGLAVLSRQAQTDPARTAAIGYCFGGATVQQLAYAGADVKGVVSFHGSPQEPPDGKAQQVQSKFLFLHGAANDFVKPEQFQSYLSAMARSGLDYQVIIYGGAKHGLPIRMPATTASRPWHTARKRIGVHGITCGRFWMRFFLPNERFRGRY